MNLMDDPPSALDRVLARYLEATDRGEIPDREELVAAHPELAGELRSWFGDQDRMQELAGRTTPGPFPIGARIGPYELEAIVGRGGMGTIYRASHSGLGRRVAIKVLAPHLALDDQLVDRFRREARALARLEHPNIVMVHDMGVEQGPDGVQHAYFIMEFVDGVNLRELMRGGELSADQALAIVPQVCEALEYAHEQGLVHRDVKPENILLDREGRVKIADFGLARVLHGESQIGNLTRTDVLMGTFDYMAPEQRRSAAVDHRADIYALGVVLFEMLTGDLPIGHFPPPSERNDAVGPALDKVVLRALETEPDRRYQRASELGRDISELRARGPIDAPIPKPSDAGGARKSPVGTKLSVVEALSGKKVGEGQTDRLRIVHRGPQSLSVKGWAREEIGLSDWAGDEDMWLGDLGLGASGIQIRGVLGERWRHKAERWNERLRRKAERVSGTGRWAQAMAHRLTVHAVVGEGSSALGENRSKVLDQLHVRVEGSEGGPQTLVLETPNAGGTIYVPFEIPVEIDAPQARIEVRGMRSALRLDPGSGRAEVHAHQGPLRVERLDNGELTIEGLESEDFQLFGADGSIRVSGLSFAAGSGVVRTQRGDVRLVPVPDRCHFQYEARTSSGVVRELLREPEKKSKRDTAQDRQRVEGWVGERAVGQGGGRLEVSAFSGDITLGQTVLSKKKLNGLLWGLFWCVVVVGSLAKEGHILGAVVVGLAWGGTAINKLCAYLIDSGRLPRALRILRGLY